MNLVLDTKLLPPRNRASLIERPGLHARLARIRETRLWSVCAPAGYGKTSALIQAYDYLREQKRNVAWVSLDEGDKDLVRFSAHLASAVGRSGIASRPLPAALFSTEISASPEHFRISILNEFALLPDEVYVVLDDYHLVQDPDIRNLVNTLLLSPVHSLRFLIGSRSHNELPLARLRALGQVQEVEIADLTFSENEVSEFVAQVRGLPLNPAQVTRLRDATEGWAASLQMAGIALRDVADVDVFLDLFSGEHRTVGDFLSEEVLSRLPPDLQEFMTLTSLLKRFNWSLCNALTGARDGRAMLEAIERRNLFLFSLDSDRKWFRYHHLFADFLRRRCADRYPERLADCHLRASAWLSAHGFQVDAIEHAFEAHDTERAGALLDRASADLFAAGQTGTLMAWSARLPKSLLERLPRLQLERAWYSELSWKFADARAALEHVEKVLSTRGSTSPVEDSDHGFLESKLAHRHMMLSVLSDHMPETARQTQDWLARDRTEDPFMCASAGTALMAAQRVMFRCEGTHTSARMLQARYIEGGALYGIVFHQCVAGATLFERGELDAAQDLYEKALQVAVELQGEHSALYNIPALMFSELHYERNRLDRAAELLAQRDISSELGFVDNLIAGFVTRGRLQIQHGRHAEAESLFREGVWLATKYGFERMQAALLNERSALLLALGHTAEVQTMQREFIGHRGTVVGAAPAEGVTQTDLLLVLAVSRLQIHLGKVREAAMRLSSWFVFTRERHCYRSTLRVGVLLARALSAAGDRRGALHTLAECLTCGGVEGFIRVFVDEGSDIAELLADLDAAGPCEPHSPVARHLDGVRRAFETPAERGRAGDAQLARATDPPDPLTAREIQIVELGARGMQNADIAQTLLLAQSTVKWYWQRIFEKLDVHRRPDAVRRARENRWIR